MTLNERSDSRYLISNRKQEAALHSASSLKNSMLYYGYKKDRVLLHPVNAVHAAKERPAKL